MANQSSSSNSKAPNAPSAICKAIEPNSRQSQHSEQRPTRLASYELTNHAKAYLEGGQFASGYNFLYSLLASATSISTPAQPYTGFLAPPAYIGLASSLIAYPALTTKATSKDAIKGSDAALRYLRCIHTTIESSAYPAIRKAFTFPEERNRRRAPANRSAAGTPSPEPGGDIERIAGVAANRQYLWNCAEDFWHIVGWAFNCSVTHKRRWDRWNLWLGTTLDFLQADWGVCVEQSEAHEANKESFLQESLVWQYIVGQAESTNRGMRRRIIKSILAMATLDSLKEYPEVWEKETAEPKQKKDINQPLGEVDFGTGEMADYESDEEMQDDPGGNDELHEAYASPSDSTDDEIRNVHDAIDQLGGQDAIQLRHRFIALLAQVALALPIHFTTLSDFFDNVLEDFIQLPIFLFHVLLPGLKIPGLLQVAFCTNLLLPLVSGTIPNFLSYEPTQEHFEKVLLPLKGTTQGFAANAKISLVLEQIFMYAMSQNILAPTGGLRKAMEDGIKVRRSVYGTGRGKRGNAEEEEQGQNLLKASSERLLGLLEMMEIAAGKGLHPPKGKQQASRVPVLLSFTSGSSLSPAPDSDTEVDE